MATMEELAKGQTYSYEERALRLDHRFHNSSHNSHLDLGGVVSSMGWHQRIRVADYRADGIVNDNADNYC